MNPIETVNDKTGKIVTLGVPFDANSSYRRGSALAPHRIREALDCDSTNYCTESGLDLKATNCWRDAGDLAIADSAKGLEIIEQQVEQILIRGDRMIALGGDHAISYPILRAYARQFPHLNVLHFDAHPDLYDELDGNRFSHACPFARVMDEQLAVRLVQLGIRTATPHQREQAARFGVETIDMRSWRPDTPLKFDGPLYLSIDLDCLDPAFAPGVSHLEPGGFTTRELLRILQGIKVPVVGADIVEYNPERDINGVTAMVAAKLLKEVIDLLVRA